MLNLLVMHFMYIVCGGVHQVCHSPIFSSMSFALYHFPLLLMLVTLECSSTPIGFLFIRALTAASTYSRKCDIAFTTCSQALFNHISIATHFGDKGKQCRPRSDAGECGVWSRCTLFAYRIFYLQNSKNENVHQTPLKLEMYLSNWLGWIGPLCKCRLIHILPIFGKFVYFVWHFPMPLISINLTISHLSLKFESLTYFAIIYCIFGCSIMTHRELTK